MWRCAHGSANARSRQRPPAALGVAALLALAACGGPAERQAAAVTADPTAPATTEAPSTSAAPVTSTTVATTAPATTVPVTSAPTTMPPTAPTTTTLVVEPLPATEPIAPPTDEYAKEPVIEMGSITIPKIDVDMTMYEGIRLTTLDHGPGHWPGSALPGQSGNVVVAGHRTSSHRVFRNIDQLVRGDEIIFRDSDGEHTYLVDRVEIVDPTAVWIVDPTATPTATLFACHPPGSTAQRIVVFADLAETDPSLEG